LDWTDDPIAAAEELAAIFESLGVRYLLGGSMAAAVWGEPRFMRDVDLVVDLAERHVAALLSALGERWYVDEKLTREAIAQRTSFNLIRFTRMVKVDVFVPPASGLHESKSGRGRRASLSHGTNRSLVVTSPEDIVLQKLDWFQRGNEVSEQQWRDVVPVLRTVGTELDGAYLRTWADEMGLELLLERARLEAGLQ